MEKVMEGFAKLFLEATENNPVKIISHHDTDGITSAAIMSKTLKKLDKFFTVKIVKQLEKGTLSQLSKNKNEVLLFLDLGSASLEELGNLPNRIFIIDHHEVLEKPRENTTLINSHLLTKEEICGSCLSYLFSKSLIGPDKELATLGVIGMVGDMHDRNLSKLTNKIIEDAEVIIKKGLLLYPATRPVHKALEYSSAMLIPGVTGNPKGAITLLREADIKPEKGRYKSLMELNEEELSRLITAIILRTDKPTEEIIGSMFLVKFLNKLEDAREISVMINACSRLGHSSTSLSFCLGNQKEMEKAAELYAQYKQEIVSGLSFAEQNKIEGKNYLIINARDNIKDTIIGTIASIVSMSSKKPAGTIVAGLAYDHEKIKVSARLVGRNGRNVREILDKTASELGGETGGHAVAAGCYIPKDKESFFIENLIKNLDLEVVKI